MNIPEEKQNQITTNIVSALTDNIPKHWSSALLELSVGDEGIRHFIKNLDDEKDEVLPSARLYAETKKLELLFQEYECMWETAIFEVFWQEEIEDWRFSVDYKLSNEVRTLSSSLTFFNKYIFIVLFSGVFGLLTINKFLSATDTGTDKYLLLFFWIGITILLYLICGRIKRVQLKGNKLNISNYIKSIEVDLSEIESVSGSILLSPELVWFKLRRPTKFGETIIFMPEVRFSSLGFTRHPMVKKLEKLSINRI